MRIIRFIEDLDAILILGTSLTMNLHKRFQILLLNWPVMKQVLEFRFLMNGIDFFELGFRDYGGLCSKSILFLGFFQNFIGNLRILPHGLVVFLG